MEKKNKKYEKPRLIKLDSLTAKGGVDCTDGSSAFDKCQQGNFAAGGDCDGFGGVAVSKCDSGPVVS